MYETQGCSSENVTAYDSIEISGHVVNMKYYWEMRWIVMLGFVKRDRFVARCVKVEFLS